MSAVYILWLRELKRYSRSRAMIVAWLSSSVNSTRWSRVTIAEKNSHMRASLQGTGERDPSDTQTEGRSTRHRDGAGFQPLHAQREVRELLLEASDVDGELLETRVDVRGR